MKNYVEPWKIFTILRPYNRIIWTPCMKKKRRSNRRLGETRGGEGPANREPNRWSSKGRENAVRVIAETKEKRYGGEKRENQVVLNNNIFCFSFYQFTNLISSVRFGSWTAKSAISFRESGEKVSGENGKTCFLVIKKMKR